MRLETITFSTFVLIGSFLHYTYASCHWREADLCLATLAVYGNVYGIVPSTEEELKVFCRYMKESHDCIKDFARGCMTDDLFDTGYVLVESTHLSYGKFCRKGSEEQKEWLKKSPCVAAHFNLTRPCIEYALAGIENLGVISNKDRYPTLCCVFNNIMQCISDIINENCEGSSEDIVTTMMRNILSDIPIVACKPFKPKSKKCVSLLPPPNSRSKGKDSDSQLVQLLAEFLSV
ncbi:uncharacterized protein [Centruroides vittatus]|uniref:uncharacterized protein n=1 Tax=Centruroides vittatus TaxID=120091 RepID=UPI00350E996C